MAARTSYNQLLNLVRAGARVVHIASFEWERVQGLCIGLSRALEVPVRTWSSSRGTSTYNDETGTWTPDDESKDDPIEAIRKLDDTKEGGILLLEDIHPFLQHHQATRWVREMCRIPRSAQKVVVLSTPLPELPLDLRKEIPTIDLPLPAIEELQQVAERVAEQHGVPFDPDLPLLEAARGLTVMEAALAFGQAAVEMRALGTSAVSHVLREKERVIRQSRVLEYYEPNADMNDVGGLDELKAWLERRGRAFGAGAREYGLDAPKGVLLLGVQGCGKSLLAKAVAASWRFPLLRFDMGRVFGGIVGESEGNMRSALHVAQALAPCVLWIDEIEKGLAGVGSSDRSDGGTTARVVGTMLTWMQEKKESVFVVATANRIEMLPPELLRKGRFDEMFFVDLPNKAIRRDILEIHLRKKGKDPKRIDLDQLAEVSLGYSGAELEEAVREGMFEAFAAGLEVRTEHVLGALRATYPLSRTMGDHIEELRRWASVRARRASKENAETLPQRPADNAPRLPQEARNPFIHEPKP